ncbi:MAG: phosphatase PAP2 family protein [Flavobacteriales bacterium]|nr:phosphatase PAP2 family protein [Flavobacteriales bacterium]
MIERIINLDFQLFHLFNTPWPGGDQIMWAVSGNWWWIPLYALLLWELWNKAQKKWGTMALYLFFIGACVTGTDVVSSRVIKPSIQRFRPSHSVELRDHVHLVVPAGATLPYRGGRYGFVSSHAANYTGIAVLIGLSLGGINWLMGLLLWSLLIGYSRIYLGVHFPLDIAGGMMLGAFWGYILWRVQNKLVLKENNS